MLPWVKKIKIGKEAEREEKKETVKSDKTRTEKKGRYKNIDQKRERERG